MELSKALLKVMGILLCLETQYVRLVQAIEQLSGDWQLSQVAHRGKWHMKEETDTISDARLPEIVRQQHELSVMHPNGVGGFYGASDDFRKATHDLRYRFPVAITARVRRQVL
jgi:hypothetical protein